VHIGGGLIYLPVRAALILIVARGSKGKKETLMGLSDDVTKVVDSVQDAGKNIKDEVSEGIHRGTADAEQKKREMAGDQMTTSEKANSILNQEKQTAQADIDAMKRDARNKT
jgi:hypothetical protein